MVKLSKIGINNLSSFLLWVLILSSPGIRVNGQIFTDPYKYPGLKEIARIFAQNFELDQYRNEHFLGFNFIRDPSGWYVVPKYLSASNSNRIMIWSPDKKYPSYIDPGKTSKDILITELISNRDLYDFTIHPFYGYPGWMEDVIRHYEKREIATLSENELYGIGRAYAQKASDIFWSHSQYSNPFMAQGVESGKRDAKLYLEYAEKSSHYFRILYERRPDYKTLVGLMDIKYANEIMDSFYELQIFGFEKEAEKFLMSFHADQLYHKFWEQYAHEILSPLKENSILFTNGDNDTYPLIWLQEIRGFRKDIKIINLSLLSDPLYYILLTRKTNAERNLKNVLDEKKQIISLSERTLLIEDETPHNLSFKNVQLLLSLQLENNNPVIRLPNGEYIIEYLTPEGLVDTLIMKSGKRGNNLSLSDYLLQNIIYAQIGKRQLYFSKGMQPRYKSMFDKDHLVDKGLFYSLERKGKNTLMFENQYFDTLSINELIEHATLAIPEPEYFSRTNIYNLILEAHFFQIYAAEYRGEYQRKHKLILDFIHNFPPAKTGINYYYLFLVDNLYKNEKTSDLAKGAFVEYFLELEDRILKTELRDEDPRDIHMLRYYQSILSLVKLSSFYENDESLKDDISFLDKTINKRLLTFPEIHFY